MLPLVKLKGICRQGMCGVIPLIVVVLCVNYLVIMGVLLMMV